MGPRKKTSPLWSHFAEPDGNFRLAKCNHCGEDIKRGNPTDPRKVCGNKNMQAHIAKKHPELNIEVEQQQAKILEARNIVTVDLRDETARGTVKIFNLRSQADRRIFLERVFPTGPVTGITTEEKRKRDMDTAIMFTIILDLQCPSQVNRGGFNVMMAVADPSFKLSTDSYYWSLLDKVYVKGKATLRAILAKDPPQHASLALDGWSHKHHGYLGLILNWINSDWQRQALCIGCVHMEERHTSHNIAQRIMENCNEWGVMAAIEMVVHDSAANMMAIYNQDDFPINCIPGRCVCHMLQLCIEGCIFNRKAVIHVIKTSRKICKKAAVSPNFYADLERLQLEKFPDEKPLLLHRDVKVRWNSTWEMFDS